VNGTAYKKRIPAFFLIFLFSAIQLLKAQEIITENKTEQTFTFKYSENPTDKERISNYFIEELAKSIPKILTYTQYSYTFTNHLTISGKKSGDGKFTGISLKTELFNAKPTGETNYKSFSIADVLMPSFADLTIEMYSENGALLKTFTFSGIKCFNNTFSSETSPIADSLFSISNIYKTSKIALYYNETAKNIFNNKINYINGYYSSEFLIEDSQDKLNKIDFGNVDMIKVYDINLDAIETTVAEIENKKYIQILGLKDKDPISFIPKFESLKQQTKKTRIIINQMMSNLDKVLYNKALEHLSQYDTLKTIEYLKKSIVANPFYAPANYQLARVYLYQNKLEESGKLISAISTKMNPDQSTLKLTIILAKDLYKAFLINGLALLKEEDFHAAVALYEKAKVYCTETPIASCDELLQKYFSQAKYGIYNSFLVVSQKALDKEILDLAELYIFKAKDYQKENTSEIISATEADGLLKILANAYVKKGFAFNLVHKYDTALVMLTKAKDLCSNYQGISCNDKLDEGIANAKKGKYKLLILKASKFNTSDDVDNAELCIKQAKEFQIENSKEISNSTSADSMLTVIKTNRYYKNIADGLIYMNSSFSSKALDKFLESRTLENSYKVTKDKRLDSLIRASARPYILEILEKASVKVWGNEIPKANKIADSAAVLQSSYNLKSDSTINAAFNTLTILIFKKICSNAQDSYNENYRNAYQSIKLKEYNTAVGYFNSCIDTVARYSNCSISDSTALAGKAKYIDPSVYQNMIKESVQFVKNSKYKEALEKYNAAGIYFNEKSIEKFGLEHFTSLKYLSQQSDNNYIYFCSKYYMNLEKYPDALYLLELLRKKGYPDNYTIDIQEGLAQKLSKVEFILNAKQKQSKAALKYVSFDSYYKYFRKAFALNWKVLKKTSQK
jgi:hypothetical protein